MTIERIEHEDGFTIIEGGGGLFGGGGRGSSGSNESQPTEADDTLRSSAKLDVLFGIGEGELEGSPSGDILRDIYFDKTPIKTAGSSETNFTKFKIDYRSGTQAQSIIDGVGNQVIAEDSVDVAVKISTGAVVRSIPANGSSYARVRIFTPRMVLQDSKGNLKGTDLKFKIEQSNNGGAYVQVPKSPFTLRGKTTSGYQRTYQFRLTGNGPWNIRVTRISDDSTTNNQRDLQWQALAYAVEAKLRYPNTALLRVQIDAEQFPSLPEVGIRIKMLRVQIPNNYNPNTRVYTGVWNGGFVMGWTNNPAWILYDMLVRDRYGAGKRISSTSVDKSSFYTIAQYCDQLVPIPGGFEPRFTCNCYIQDRTSAYELLNSLASVMRGMLYWNTGTVFLTQDKATQPVKLFTEANVIQNDDGITFNYAGSGLKARHSVCLVSWFDEDDFHKVKVEYVEDADAIARYGYRPIELTAFGCTSRTQARRVGLWTLYTESLETQTITFKTNLYGAQLAPGELFNVADPMRAGVQMGGRILNADPDRVALDRNVTLQTGKNYNLIVLGPDGNSQSRGVDNNPGTYNELAVSPDYTVQPSGVWVLETNSLESQIFRCVSISEGEQNVYDITGISYNASKYAAIDRNRPIFEEDISDLGDPLKVAPVTNLKLEEALYTTTPSAGVKIRLDIGWQHSSSENIFAYYVEYKQDDGGYEKLITTSDINATILDVEEGIYTVRVQAQNRIGARSPWTYQTNTIGGFKTPPGDVQNFRIQILERTALLTWDTSPDLDVQIGGEYIIKHSPLTSGANWANAQYIGSAPGKATSDSVPLLGGTYLIKAVDSRNQLSGNPAVIITNIPSVLGFNTDTTLTEQPGFTGTKTNVTLSGGTIYLTSLASLGYYAFSVPFDLGHVYTSRINSQLISNTANTTNLWDNATGLFDSRTGLWDGGDNDAAIAVLEVSTSQDNVNFDAFRPFTVGDFKARTFKFRAKLESFDGETNVIITTCQVNIDMTDRVLSGNVTSNTGSDQSVSFVPAFRNQPKIGITLQNGVTGDRINVVSVNRSTLVFSVYNSAGTRVARSCDWMANGYGRED